MLPRKKSRKKRKMIGYIILEKIPGSFALGAGI